jgi:hypothetical protein
MEAVCSSDTSLLGYVVTPKTRIINVTVLLTSTREVAIPLKLKLILVGSILSSHFKENNTSLLQRSVG